MKKKINIAVIIAALAITAGWNYNQSKNEMNISDLASENVEALAQNENDGLCSKNGYKSWNTSTTDPGNPKKEFKNCWCIDKTGYNPVACTI